MESNRFQVKIYALEPRPLERFIPVFHRWIREKALDELAIDVADYGHVLEGPGVVLIGHAYDYFWDQGEGRPGLVYTRKRDPKAPAERLAEGVRRVLQGARLIEADAELSGLKFATNEILVRALDRLRAPATDAGFAELKSELEGLAGKLYGSNSVSIERTGDARDPLSARIKVASGPSLADLLARLG